MVCLGAVAFHDTLPPKPSPDFMNRPGVSRRMFNTIMPHNMCTLLYQEIQRLEVCWASCQ